jgi:hypothetical protein
MRNTEQPCIHFSPDANMKFTNLYNVAPCPRLFVLDKCGFVRHTNEHADGAPQHQDERLIASRAYAAVQECAAPRTAALGATDASTPAPRAAGTRQR